jgi:hypothetical protein
MPKNDRRYIFFKTAQQVLSQKANYSPVMQGYIYTPDIHDASQEIIETTKNPSMLTHHSSSITIQPSKISSEPIYQC